MPVNMACLGPQDITGLGRKYSRIYVFAALPRRAAEIWFNRRLLRRERTGIRAASCLALRGFFEGGRP